MFILPKISVKYIVRLKSIIKEVGANLFKKEDQKYNLISYINEDDDLTLREVLMGIYIDSIILSIIFKIMLYFCNKTLYLY